MEARVTGILSERSGLGFADITAALFAIRLSNDLSSFFHSEHFLRGRPRLVGDI